MLNPQSTNITVGMTKRTLTALNTQKVSTVEIEVQKMREEIVKVNETISEQSTAIINDCNAIIMSALTKYVETGDYNTFKSTVETQLSVMASEISMKFNQSMGEINDVEGDLQGKFTELNKYIRFSVDGIEIGESKSPLKLVIDNDMIQFTKDNVTLGWWDGTDFHTGNLVVDVKERAQFGNFAFIPRSDGSLQLKKVGG